MIVPLAIRRLDHAPSQPGHATTLGKHLEQGLSPTMVTRPQPQTWVVSTAGTHRSAYLRGKVDAGRARAAAGGHGAICYFEWSAVEGSDPADPATWWGVYAGARPHRRRADHRVRVREAGPGRLLPGLPELVA